MPACVVTFNTSTRRKGVVKQRRIGDVECMKAQNNLNAEHINSVQTLNTGGQMVVDLVTLKSGQVLCVSEEAVALYASMEAFEDSQPERGKSFAL